MGLISKLTSASTGGAVKYTGKREAVTEAALAEAKLADEQRKGLRAERRGEAAEAAADRTAEAEDAAQGKPWYRQPTQGAAISAARRGEQAKP
jgi:hypothetical protein